MSAPPGGLLYYDPVRQGELPARLGAGWQAIGATAGAAAEEAGRQLRQLGLSIADLPVLLLLGEDAWGGPGLAAEVPAADDGFGGRGGAGGFGIGKRRLRLLGVRLSAAEVARLAASGSFPASRVVVYGSHGCSDCGRARRLLDEARLSYGEVDLDGDADAEALVLRRSGGRRVVPTLLFDDRLWAFNPDPPLLRRILRGA